jgi:hypothetical protein
LRMLQKKGANDHLAAKCPDGHFFCALQNRYFFNLRAITNNELFGFAFSVRQTYRIIIFEV